MDYTVGSIAALITGNDTGDKIKVKKISVKLNEKKQGKGKKLDIKQVNEGDANQKKKCLSTSKNNINEHDDEVSSSEPILKKKRNKKRKEKNGMSDCQQGENVENISSIISNIKKNKKRKVSNDGTVEEQFNEEDTTEPSPKKNRAKKTKLSTSSHLIGSDNGEEEEQVNGKGSLERNLKIKKVKKDKLSTNSVANSIVDSDAEQENGDQIVDDGKQVEKKVKITPDPEELLRTVYVGNVPIDCKKKNIKSVFKKYGPIETLRFRGIPVADPKIPKKVAAIKKEFHPDRKSIFCFIRFVKQEDAQNAVQENGNVFKEHHLCVRWCGSTTKNDECKAIFVGNLNFRAEEEQLWKLFEPCGLIESVRIVRDSCTGMGKGFGYVNFKDADAVQLALEMENVKLGDRELRIKLSSVNTAKKNKKKENQSNATRRMDMRKKKSGDDAGRNFQGIRLNNKNKKFKVNKGDLKKKLKVKKIAPNSK
ncbi:RNA-binding protein 34 [Diorhabda carinulata]|uniref:RNA-binding protein 34 n=1 Tax=Diorhabda carinulata TaxID=1163345 RepID=UPI0025A1EECD|nr:RNA-binding protein 34 [Diorhabda carinulata]